MDIGVGARVIGGIQIGNEVRIGAGTVVVIDCKETGTVLVGVLAYPKR